jgi:DNA-binding transcriptional LysR family regulator
MADDEQLLSLLAIAEHGSISAAAEHLHRGQSAISERLRKLTELVGEPLYTREINGVKLTQAGAWVRARLHEVENLSTGAQKAYLRIMTRNLP